MKEKKLLKELVINRLFAIVNEAIEAATLAVVSAKESRNSESKVVLVINMRRVEK